jgi:hypothetical protein
VKERVMKCRGGWALSATLLLAALWLMNVSAVAAGPAGTITVKWNTQPIVKIAITPNYASGFGQIPAIIGTQPAPTHGPGASSDSGSVDFGNVSGGTNYIYRYAAHIAVTSTDANGVNLYGEGAANFVNNTDSSTYPISNSVYYLNSTSGSPPDNNTGFSPATAFLKTNGMVSGGGDNIMTPASIVYTVYPSPISTSLTPGNTNFYYDFQLKVPLAATLGNYYVWIVYTVVGR